jgi:hypothetical protein
MAISDFLLQNIEIIGRFTGYKEHEYEKVICHVQIDMLLTPCDYKTCEKVIYFVQTGMSLTYCNYKTKEHRILESDVWYSNRHLQTVITKQSMEYEEVMCHTHTGMSLTYCDYNGI